MYLLYLLYLLLLMLSVLLTFLALSALLMFLVLLVLIVLVCASVLPIKSTTLGSGVTKVMAFFVLLKFGLEVRMLESTTGVGGIDRTGQVLGFSNCLCMFG